MPLTSCSVPTSTGVGARQEIGLGDNRELERSKRKEGQGNVRYPLLLVEALRKMKLPLKL